MLPSDGCPGFIMLLAAGRIPGPSSETCLRRGGAGLAIKGFRPPAVRSGGCIFFGKCGCSTCSVIDRRSLFLPEPSSSEKGDGGKLRSNARSAFSHMIRPSSGGRQPVEVSGHPVAMSDFPSTPRGRRWSMVATGRGKPAARRCRTSSEVQRSRARRLPQWHGMERPEVSSGISNRAVSCRGVSAARGLQMASSCGSTGSWLILRCFFGSNGGPACEPDEPAVRADR